MKIFDPKRTCSWLGCVLTFSWPLLWKTQERERKRKK